MRSVTFDGDTYDPSGNLSGGSRSSFGGVLLKTGELRSLRSQIGDHRRKKDSLCQEFEELEKISNHYYNIKQSLELKEHAHHLLEERISSSSNALVYYLYHIDK